MVCLHASPLIFLPLSYPGKALGGEEETPGLLTTVLVIPSRTCGYQPGTRHPIHVRFLYCLQFPTLLSSLAPHRFSSFPLTSPTQLSQDVKHGDMAERGLDLK